MTFGKKNGLSLALGLMVYEITPKDLAMKIYLYLIPLVLVIACSRRADDDNMRILLPWPDANGIHSLQVVEVKTLHDMRKMKGDAAEVYVYPGITETGMDAIAPNAQFSKSADGYYVPKDTITQEMATIYAHTERLKELDQSVGIDILISWPRKVGVETKATDGRTHLTISENAMYLSAQDVTLYFPYQKGSLPISLNAGIIAHEHFHTIFQRIVIDTLATKFNVETFGKPSINKPLSDEEIARREIEANNRYILRALNEGLADVWGTIYINRPEFISQSLDSGNRDANPELLISRSLQNFVPNRFGSTPEIFHEPNAYSLGVQYSRLIYKAMQTEKLALTNKTSKAIFVIETLTRLRDLLMDNFDQKIHADILAEAIFVKDELNEQNCEWLKPLLNANNSRYGSTCDTILNK